MGWIGIMTRGLGTTELVLGLLGIATAVLAGRAAVKGLWMGSRVAEEEPPSTNRTVSPERPAIDGAEDRQKDEGFLSRDFDDWYDEREFEGGE